MTMQTWDVEVAPFLRILESRSGWLQQDTINIVHDLEGMERALDALPYQPDFETRAIASLVGAERSLLEALERVRAMKEAYSNLPSEFQGTAQ